MEDQKYVGLADNFKDDVEDQHRPRARWSWSQRMRCACMLYVLLVPLLGFLAPTMAYPGQYLSPDGPLPEPGAQTFTFKSSVDGTRLQGVSFAFANATKLVPVLFFGGNAELMNSSVYMGALAFSKLGQARDGALAFRVYSSSYRGYLPNPGKPSEFICGSDACDLLAYALKETNSSAALVAGWSMGAAVAFQLAKRCSARVSGLLVVSPWSTLWTEAVHVMPLAVPWLWLLPLSLDKWDSEAAAASLPAALPLAVLSSQADVLVSPEQHRDVYNAAASTKKRWLPVAGAQHMDVLPMFEAQKEQLTAWVGTSMQGVTDSQLWLAQYTA